MAWYASRTSQVHVFDPPESPTSRQHCLWAFSMVDFAPPLQGVGQGNGAGPAIGVVIRR
jgi:hypothetical protein